MKESQVVFFSRRKRRVITVAGILTITIIAAAIATFLVLREKHGHDEYQERPEVTVEEGTLRGEWVDIDVRGAVGERYAAYRGVPYAAKPIGQLRFKAPRRGEKWDGVRDATTEGSECLQENTSSTSISTLGSEDCLYLNVYVPQTQNHAEIARPVYFFIHGGSFNSGSGTSMIYGPEFFMLQNVIVVTINYRLNVFGYLNLDNSDVPGNAGLKDQVAALQWVHRNIGRFGGDPNLITVGGQSSGSASAHWLTLLPQSRDLIKRAILESGSALESWSYHEENFEIALDLGHRLANGAVKLEDVSRLVMELPALDIMKASIPMVNNRSLTFATEIPYAVSPERRTSHVEDEEPFVTSDPEKLIIDQSRKPIPLLMGMNNREYLQGYYTAGYAANPDLVKYRINHLYYLIQKNIIPYSDTILYLNLTAAAASFHWDDVTSEVHDFFFNRNDPNCDTICTFKLYLDDVSFGVDTQRLADLRARANNSETFVYRFGVRDMYNIAPRLDPGQGAVHADELGYLWKITYLRQKLEGDGLASDTLRRMTNIWGSYITHGTPSPKENYEGIWKPTEKRMSAIIFLNIEDSISIKEENIAGTSMPFWLKLHQKYRSNKST